MCEHLSFEAFVNVNHLQDKESGPITGYQADVRIRCVECKLPFRFIGLPYGLDLNGAAVSSDGQEAHLAIIPNDQAIKNN